MASDLAPAACYFGAHTDKELRLRLGSHENDSRHLRATINWHALFHEKLITTDSMIIYDPLLRELFQSTGYRGFEYDRLLTDGILVPAIRSSERSLLGVLKTQRQDNIHSAKSSDGLEDFAGWLDDKCTAHMTFDLQQMGGSYTGLMESILDDASLMKQFQLQDHRDSLRRFLEIERAKTGAPRGILRTDFWNYALTQVPAEQGEVAKRVFEISAAAYHGNGATILDGDPVYPVDLDRLTNATRLLHRVRDDEIPQREWFERILVSFQTTFPLDAIGAVPFGVILDIRKGAAFKEYMERVTRAVRLPTPEEKANAYWKAVAAALPSYWASLEPLIVEALGNQYFEQRRRRRDIRVIGVGSSVGNWAVRIAELVPAAAGLLVGHPEVGGAITGAAFAIDMAIAFGNHVRDRREAQVAEAQRNARVAVIRATLPPLPPRR